MAPKQRTRRGALFFYAPITLLIAACATVPLPPQGAAVQLANVPAFTQAELQCGPAALASTLTASGVPTTPESLSSDLFIPARKGSLQVELLAQARQRGRVPLQLDGSEAQLLAALREGTPVLMLLNLGVRSYPIWHYAVLTGYDPDGGYTLNAGRAAPEQDSRRTLLRRWDWAGRWAITLHRPDQIPAYASPPAWIAAAAPLERQQPTAATEAYAAAVQRWPTSALAQAALGARRFAEGDLRAARQALTEAHRLAPQDAAIANNLATVELARGCRQQALAVLEGLELESAPPAVAEALTQTRQEIAAAPERACPVEPAQPAER